MKRALLLGLVIALTSGCAFHVRTGVRRPGLVDLATPPPSTLTTPVVPEDPGERGLSLHGTLHFGGLVREKGNGTIFGGELGLYPYVADKAGGRFVFGGRMQAFGAAVGWTFYRRLDAKSDAPGDGIGPLYVEGRAYYGPSGLGVFRFGLGGAINPLYFSAGPQASSCVSISPMLFSFCVRGAYMIGEGAEMGITVEMGSFLDVSWSR